MKARVRIDTMSDIRGFVNAVSRVSAPVVLTDGNHFSVSAKSILGAMYSMEWNEIYCTCDIDIYTLIQDYVITE